MRETCGVLLVILAVVALAVEVVWWVKGWGAFWHPTTPGERALVGIIAWSALSRLAHHYSGKLLRVT